MRAKRFAAAGAAVLAGVVLLGGAAAGASGGTEDDPLVTLSYLTQVVTPQLMDAVDEQVQANEKALEDKLDAAIADYSAQMEQALAQGGTGAGASYEAVHVAAGRTLSLSAGVELIVRTGGVKAVAGTSPVLLDTTAGTSLEAGAALEANHLYVVPLEGASVTTTSDSVLLVLGEYGVY